METNYQRQGKQIWKKIVVLVMNLETHVLKYGNKVKES